MSSGGGVTLREIASKMVMLEVACSRCSRHGWLSIARLIEQHGADARLPDLREVLAHDCPRIHAGSTFDRCGVHYPQLA